MRDRATRRAELIGRLESMFVRHAALLDDAEAVLRGDRLAPREDLLDASEARELEHIVDELGRLDGPYPARATG